MFKIKKIFFFIISFAIILAPSAVFAQWVSPEVPVGSNLPDVTIGEVILQITNWILGFVTAIAVLALIWGGVRYLTAAGDDSQVEKAKNIITQAIIGLVIAGISYSAVAVVVSKWIK